MLLEFCLEKELCVSNSWFEREEQRKVTFTMGENETEIDFVLTKKEYRWFEGNPWKFQHALVVTDIDKRKIRNVVRETCTERRKSSLLKDVKIRKRFHEKVITLVGIVAQNFMRIFNRCGYKGIRCGVLE